MGAIAGPPTLASLRAQALVDVPIAPSGSSAFEFSQSIDVTGNLAGNTQFGFRLSGFGANGEDADDANAESGGFSGNVSSLVTAATFNLTANQNTLVVIGTTTQLIGGNGGNQTNQNISNNGGPGGEAGNIVATNSGDVVLQGIFGGERPSWITKAAGDRADRWRLPGRMIPGSRSSMVAREVRAATAAASA